MDLFGDWLKAPQDFLASAQAKSNEFLSNLKRDSNTPSPAKKSSCNCAGWLIVPAALFSISWSSYALYNTIMKLRMSQNLKQKYIGAEWALVTGGSSGIGRAIVEKLAGQGLNVVIVAYPDALLESSFKELTEKFKQVKFKKVGLDLSDSKLSYMEKLTKETKGIVISCLFNNAGYIKTGFYSETTLESQMQNLHCNSTSAAALTHWFLQQIKPKIQKGKKVGCITFTSSPAGFLPCPFSVMYGSTKAFLTTFAASLAPEVYSDGIEVCVVHPSPVASNFYSRVSHQIDALSFFKKTATGPETIANSLFQSIGRTVICDQGYYPFVVKNILKIIDYNLITDIMVTFASSLPDFKRLKAKSSFPLCSLL